MSTISIKTVSKTCFVIYVYKTAGTALIESYIDLPRLRTNYLYSNAKKGLLIRSLPNFRGSPAGLIWRLLIISLKSSIENINTHFDFYIWKNGITWNATYFKVRAIQSESQCTFEKSSDRVDRTVTIYSTRRQTISLG